MLVTGSSNGRITFYNYQLQLLYWCQHCNIESIRWISFDPYSNLLSPVFTTNMSDNEKYEANGKIEMASSKFITNAKHVSRNNKTFSEVKSSYPPMDATLLDGSPLNIRNFLACSFTGVIALVEIPKQKWHFILHHPVAAAISIDAHPESNYIAVGDMQGTLRLYNYEEHTLLISRRMPTLPDFRPILEKEQTVDKKIIYVTCPQRHESLKAITALKFSPKCSMLVCGMENGAIWILHHITLDLLEEIPYKHSSAAVNKITFASCANYMAYTDDALTVVVFKRNNIASKEVNLWNLIGKYHSHYLPIRDILFGPATSDSAGSRFFSLGEDRELIEYDLERSGPYPTPGLQILRIDRIEQSAIPLCLAWYPEFGVERFLMISNSQYKYKIFDVTKTIRGTYLGPIFGEPVQQFQVLTKKLVNHNSYMVFATDKEIGLQLLPFDGNPYKIVGMTGHPRKITNIAVSNNREILFTTGYNDPCVLMWKIKLRSVDLMAQLGGEGLSPFHCLVEGERKTRWLINEMKALFYYVQMLEQKENTAAARIISDTVAIEQIPNLMRAVGYFLTNEEIENIKTEVRYRNYIETGKFVERITFEEFVKLYVNHRPAFGLCMRQIKEAFRNFIDENSINMKNPTLTREQFINILLGKVTSKTSIEDDERVGKSKLTSLTLRVTTLSNCEPLTLEEAYTYLKLLVPSDKETTEPSIPSERDVFFNFLFLPPTISYKDFAVDIMGIETLEETEVDNRRNQHDDYP